MARIKGSPKTGGRKKGTPNKRTVYGVEMLRARYPDWDPLDQLAYTAQHDEDPDRRLAAAKDACSYFYPRRKAVEHSGEVDMVDSAAVAAILVALRGSQSGSE
jgi:hypothetical protein